MGVEGGVGTSLLLNPHEPSAIENLGWAHLGSVSSGQYDVTVAVGILVIGTVGTSGL